MDGLRDIAQQNFQLYDKFRGPIPKTEDENKVQTIQILTSPNGKPHITNTFVAENNLSLTSPEHDALSQPKPKQSTATLQVTIISRSHEEVISMSKPTFLRLFESYNLDPYALNYISQNWYGFHSAATPHNGAYTSFLGTVPFAILFSFNPTTLTTSAIFLTRVYNGLSSGLQVTQEFSDILGQYADRIDIPEVLMLVALIHLGKWQDEVLYKSLQMIRSAEDVSGYGPSGTVSKRVDIDDLLGVQWKIGEIVLGLANVDRHHDIAQSLFGYLDKRLGPGGSTVGMDEQLGRGYKGLDDVVNVLRQQFAGANSTTAYLKERTQCHSAVASGLLTHEDALVSMEQNSSMKTIAVVTMAFLPGTFFATLFAVPSLQWDQSPVIQGTFWIYWVFTLPFTALVMGMWYFSTRDWRQEVHDAKRNLVNTWRRKQQKGGRV